MVHLITGYYGYEHIKSADQRAFNAAFFGDGQNVLDFGNKFAASIVNNNTVRIADGEGLMFGGHFRIETNTYEDVTITTGTTGVNRIDLICVTYKKNEADGTEQTYLEVIKGTEASSPTTPAYTTGNLLEGATFNQMPLFKVTINGVVLASVEPMFTIIPTYKKLAEQYAQKFQDEVEAYSETVENAASVASAAKSAAQTAQNTADGKAPKSHASSATTYGAGNGSNYGHVKLSDSTSSTSGVSGGIAATPAAVKSAYDRASTGIANAATAQDTANTAKATAEAAMPKSGGTFTNQTIYKTTNQQPIAFNMPNAELGKTPSTAQVAMLTVRDKNAAIIGKFQVAQHITGVTETVLSATDETGTSSLSLGITATGKKYLHFNGEDVMATLGLLWENASPQSSFAAQTVSVGLATGDIALVEFTGGSGGSHFSAIVENCFTDCKHILRGMFSSSAGIDANTTRLFTINSSGNFVFKEGRIYNSYGTATTDNIACIPVKIYKLKGVV